MTLFERLLARIQRTLHDHENAPPWQRRLGSLFLAFAPRQLTCAEFERFVLDYHEGLLSERQRSTFELHMWMCPMCDVYFKSYVKSVQMGQRLYEDEDGDSPADLPDELVAAILESRRS